MKNPEVVIEKVKVIANSQHSLKEEQVRILNEKFGEDQWEIFVVPAEGWNRDQILKLAGEFEGGFFKRTRTVFVSPIPLLLAKLSCIVGDQDARGVSCTDVWVFHNDNRVKKEVDGGKIISAVAPTGWELIAI